MTTHANVSDTARGILESIEGDRAVLHLAHTDYYLYLRVEDGSMLSDRVGKRVRGVIHGRALRLHPTAGGGRFVEPLVGEPRIVTGTLRAVDDAGSRLLVDVSVPMWLETEPDQDFDGLALGGLVTCYVESGARFVPEASR